MTAPREYRPPGPDPSRRPVCEDVELWIRGDRSERHDDADLELHLESCPTCRERFSEIRILLAVKPAVEDPSAVPPVPVTVWRPRIRDLAVAGILLAVLLASASRDRVSVSHSAPRPVPRFVGRPVTPASVRVEQERRGFGERRFASLVRRGPTVPVRHRRAMRWESP
ncbi:MAG TPA: hypothetical protein ENK43_14695 [Planctomycetes bacterium]|nr:hypothetical protein [Planctomycetota bacterium]